MDVTISDKKSDSAQSSAKNESGQSPSQQKPDENALLQHESDTHPPAHEPVDSGAAKPAYRQKLPLIAFIGANLIYLSLAISMIDQKYVDFGDGNYLYLAWRVTQGEVLFRDLPSPQPPLMLFLGAILLAPLDGDAALVRLWQAIQHCLIAFLVFGIAWRLFKDRTSACLAGCIYLFLPIGVWWAAGWQAHPVFILVKCWSVLLLLTAVERDRPTAALYGAGALSALTWYVSMTATPYLLLQWFFVWFSFRRFFLRYSFALIATWALMFAAMWVYSEGSYVEVVIGRQAGTFPTQSLWGFLDYAWRKLYTDGGVIIEYEGAFVFAAIAGMLLTAGLPKSQAHPAQAYALWWGVFSLGSIIYVTKGGTVNYIFTIGEPAVAVFSAYFLMELWRSVGWPGSFKTLALDPLRLGALTLIVCLALPAATMRPAMLLYRVFSNASGPAMRGGVFELSDEEMRRLSLFIRRYVPEDGLMLSPPYYAFAAKRPIAENMSELFVLAHAYFHELNRLQTSRDLPFQLPGLFQAHLADYRRQDIDALDALFLAEPELAKEYRVIAQALRVREQIRQGEISLIIKNEGHPFFLITPIHQAIRDYAIEIPSELIPELNPREENLVFYSTRSPIRE